MQDHNYTKKGVVYNNGISTVINSSFILLLFGSCLIHLGPPQRQHC